MSSAKTMRVGTQNSTGSLDKAVRVPWREVIPNNDTTPWLVSDYLSVGATGNVENYGAPVVLQKGVTLTGFRARLYRESTADTALARLRRTGDSATGTNLVTLNSTSTGWVTLTSSTVNQLVGDETYTIAVQLRCVSTATGARYLWAEPLYTMPSYDKAV